MDHKRTEITKQYIKRYRQKDLWRKIVSVLGCFVVFCTTYALILPAITMDQGTICGMVEHQHTSDCYIMPESGHVHIDDCYTETVTYTCGMEETQEDDGFFAGLFGDANSTPSAVEYEPAHSHTDACTESSIELTCGMEEAVPHRHDDTCFDENGELICELPTELEEPLLVCDITPHIHSDGCFPSDKEEKDSTWQLVSVDQVISLINAMPSADEIDEQLMWYEDAEDYEGEEAYYTKVCRQVAEVYHKYLMLSDEQKTQVTNADKLLELEYIWSVYTLEELAIDLNNHVTNVTVQRKPAGTSSWLAVENGQVQTGDSLRFKIEYRIDGKTLDKEHPTVTYQVPAQITAVKAENGIVYQGTTAVGTYTISEAGLITITFYENYAVSNAEGADITGFVSFEASVDAISTDSAGNAELPFKDKITIQVTDKENNTSDLQITKEALNVNLQNGTVDYKIVVTSEKGTASVVKLEDVMTNIAVSGDITIKDKAGRTIQTIKNAGRNFSATLPKMNAGDFYTITYSAKISNADSLNGTVHADNTVKVSSTDSSGGKIADEDDVNTTFERNVIEKSGSLQGSTITWTVIINESKVDIGGWVLSDVLNNSAYTGRVTISPNPQTGNGSVTVNLPYTFPSGSNKKYTVTYTSEMGSNQVSSTNTATLTPPGKNGISDGWTVTNGSYDPLEKDAAGKVYIFGTEGNDKLAAYNWNVTIDAKDGAIEPFTKTLHGQSQPNLFWYYDDELWNEASHWITGAQLKDMAERLDSSYNGDFTVLAYRWDGTGANKYRNPVTLDQVSDETRYSQFSILFYNTLQKGSRISFSYATTGNIGDGKGNVSLTNRGIVNGNITDDASQSYNPIVTKVDKKGSGSTTSHNYTDLTMDKNSTKYEGVLGWNIKITFPDITYTEDVVIVEDIPFGTELLNRASGEWHLSFDGSDFEFRGESQRTIKKEGYTVTAYKENNAYRIVVPKELAAYYASQNKTVNMEVRVQIDKDYDWDKSREEFENNITITHNGIELGKATQTQIIRKPTIGKQSGTVSNNIVPYTLVINQDGKDLVKGADTLTLTDTLEYPKTTSANASLLTEAVKVYQLRSDGTETDITAQCPYTFTETAGSELYQKVITMTIPDDMPLRVEYSYMITGKLGTEVKLSNTASIEGLGQTEDYEEDKISVSIQESNAGAMLVGVTITKVDASNYALHLTGATFRLEKWDATQQKYVDAGVSLKTDEKGKASTGELEYNVAYRLIETAAPDGYMIDPTPYLFYVADSSSNVVSSPSGFDGRVLNNGDNVIITNTTAVYELPETGGTGTYVYILAGLMLIAVSTMLLYNQNRRRREDA